MNPPLPTVQTLVESLSEYGDRPALVVMESEGPRLWSYGRLARVVQRWAAGLAQRGIGPGDQVGLLAENRPEWLIACLAVLRAGAVVVPLDIQSGDETLGHVLADSGARLFFTSGDQAARFDRLPPATRPELIRFETLEESESPFRSRHEGQAFKLPIRTPDDPAILFYTSGTTGPPKGVPLTHRNLAFQVRTISDSNLVMAEDRVLVPLPFHHVYPLVIGLLVPLGLGLPIILPGGLTGPQILRAIKEGQATAVIGVPRLYQALHTGIRAKAASRGRLAEVFFAASAGASTWIRRRAGIRAGKYLLRPLHRQFGPSLRLLASGGSALDPELAWKLEGLGWQVAIGYGLTETAPLLTINAPGTGRLESVGRPIPGVELRIDFSARPAGDGADRNEKNWGEVQARGPNVFRGYRGLPEKTAEAFTADGWFRTGDLGWLDQEGFLHLQGRSSTLIVTESGKNIQPDEVEERLGAHPFISEAGVLQHQGRLAAVIVPDLPILHQAGERDLQEAMRRAVTEQSRKLASYQRPDEYAISRDPLPRTRLGKIRRHLLPGRYQQARNGHDSRAPKGPLSPAEMSDHDRALLAAPVAMTVWDWLASRHPEVRLTPDTSPHFDLGIDSLEWLNLTMEIDRQAGVELSEEAVGRIETVRDLLHEVIEQSEQGRKVSPARPLERPEEVIDHRQLRWLAPLNPLQLLLAWLLYHLNRAIMRMCFRLRVEGLDRVPAAGQFVLAPNHVSYLDSFLIAAALPFGVLRRTYFAGWTGVAFRNRLFRFVSRLGKTIPIDPRKAVGTSLAMAAMVLKQKSNLIWFPEGERSHSGNLQDLRPGLGMLLDHYPVPVVPSYIRGAYEALPRHRFWPRFRHITVSFGSPDLPEVLAARGRGETRQERITSGLFRRLAAMEAGDDQQGRPAGQN